MILFLLYCIKPFKSNTLCIQIIDVDNILNALDQTFATPQTHIRIILN